MELVVLVNFHQTEMTVFRRLNGCSVGLRRTRDSGKGLNEHGGTVTLNIVLVFLSQR